MTTEFNESFERRVNRTSLILIVLASIVVALFYSARAAASLIAGGLLSTINFHWLKKAVDFVVIHGGQGPVGKRIAFRYAARYALIALALYVTLRFSILDPVLVLAGLLVYVVAVLFESIFEIGKTLIRDRNGRT